MRTIKILSFLLVVALMACTGEMQSVFESEGSKSAQALLGVYTFSGQDEHGSYLGEAEFYTANDGQLVLAYVQNYEHLNYQGQRVSRAWEGKVEELADAIHITVALDQSGYILSQDGYTRPSLPLAPLIVIGKVSKPASQELAVTWLANGAKMNSELWRRSRAGEPQRPIWQNLRRRVASHGSPSASRKSQYWQLFESYRKLPEVQPYVQHADFNAAIHYSEVDPTDFAYYQGGGQGIRVIQKTLNPASMQEALRRRWAYAPRLLQKELVLAKTMSRSQGGNLVNAVGILQYADGTHNVDSLLWTGSFVASQALRYLVTGSQQAYQDMLFSLEGMITCYTITGQPGVFARTLRPIATGVADDRRWIRGTGAYANIEWLSGGNNDMVKGFFVGFTAAVLALRKHGGEGNRVAKIKDIMAELLRSNGELFDNAQKSVNKVLALLMIAAFTEDMEERIRVQSEYQALYNVARKALENNVQYDNGLTDWSGNNLYAIDLWVYYLLTDYLNHSHQKDIMELARGAYKKVGQLRTGFVRGVFSVLGWPAGQRPTDFIWDLREFIAPKYTEDQIDWRRSYNFTLSPYPSLPWKQDWTTNDRFQPLVSYPYFEQPSTNHQWKSLPEFRADPNSRGFFAADYLVAYWFARYYQMVGAQD